MANYDDEKMIMVVTRGCTAKCLITLGSQSEENKRKYVYETTNATGRQIPIQKNELKDVV